MLAKLDQPTFSVVTKTEKNKIIRQPLSYETQFDTFVPCSTLKKYDGDMR